MEGKRAEFLRQLQSLSSDGKSMSFLTEEQYRKTIEQIKTAKNKTTKKSSREYHLIQRFEVIKVKLYVYSLQLTRGSLSLYCVSPRRTNAT